MTVLGQCRRVCSALAIVLVSLLVGCWDSGPTVYKVSGVVSLKGKPLPYGSVTFHAPNGRDVVGCKIDSEGSYSVSLLPGQHRVTVVAKPPVEIPAGQSYESMAQVPPAKKGQPEAPARYGDTSTSGLYCNVYPKDNNHDIELE